MLEYGVNFFFFGISFSGVLPPEDVVPSGPSFS